MSSASGGGASDGTGGGGGAGKEDAVSKAAGFVVFSGIAMSIIKALTPEPLHQPTEPPSQSSDRPPPLHDLPAKAPAAEDEHCGMAAPARGVRTIEIVPGDTLWGLSRKHGVPIGEIKKANGLTGDTIYAGKKLVIP